MDGTGPRTDEAAMLVTRIAGGDREVFARFCDAFAGVALALIRRISRDPSKV